MVTYVWWVIQRTTIHLKLIKPCAIDMINIFEVFLPQLLRYPNPNDPLNGEAAALLMRHPKEYEIKVKGKFAQYYECPCRILMALQSMYKDTPRKKQQMLQQMVMKAKMKMK